MVRISQRFAIKSRVHNPASKVRAVLCKKPMALEELSERLLRFVSEPLRFRDQKKVPFCSSPIRAKLLTEVDGGSETNLKP